ncbi:MAG: hypothetical protein ACH346_08255 [Chthoniobacterales bacterium]
MNKKNIITNASKKIHHKEQKRILTFLKGVGVSISVREIEMKSIQELSDI